MGIAVGGIALIVLGPWPTAAGETSRPARDAAVTRWEPDIAALEALEAGHAVRVQHQVIGLGRAQLHAVGVALELRHGRQVGTEARHRGGRCVQGRHVHQARRHHGRHHRGRAAQGARRIRE